MRERSPGTWQLRVYLGRDGQSKPIQVGRFFKGSKRQAQTELARLMVEVEHRTVRGPVTVAQLLERWLEHITPLGEPRTLRGHRTYAATAPRQPRGAPGGLRGGAGPTR